MEEGLVILFVCGVFVLRVLLRREARIAREERARKIAEQRFAQLVKEYLAAQVSKEDQS